MSINIIGAIASAKKLNQLLEEIDKMYESVQTTLEPILDMWNDYGTISLDSVATISTNLGIDEETFAERRTAFFVIKTLYNEIVFDYEICNRTRNTYSTNHTITVECALKHLCEVRNDIRCCKEFKLMMTHLTNALNNLPEYALDTPCTMREYLKSTVDWIAY